MTRDCKSLAFELRRFESYFQHHFFIKKIGHRASRESFFLYLHFAFRSCYNKIMKKVMRCNIFIATTLFFAASLIKVNPARADSITEFNIDVTPVLSVSMSNVNLEATVGALATGTGALSISSNNATGYNTFITSSSAETALIDLSEEYQIPSITTTTTAANFPTNAWGMSVDGTNYDGITPLGSNTPAITTLSSSVPSTITQNISFATKVDATTPAGTYSNSILITVVPNYVPITLTESYNLAGKTRVFGNDGHKYYSMQDMNPAICNTTDKEHSSIQVVDERDNKVYWITKLKDGNCWMTQNLDFEISTDGTELFAATSDVESDRTLTAVAWDTDNDSIYYMDGGDDYYVNGVTKTASYSNLPTNSEDRHYAAGDYYSWKTATAGQGTTDIINVDTTESICPKGWRLPAGDSYVADKSLGKLTDIYGATNGANGTSDTSLLASPLFFTYSGSVHSDSLYDWGSYGRYWSTRANSGTGYAYGLSFGSTFVYPNNYYGRNYGFSIRCVAHGNKISLNYDANGGTNAPFVSIAESNNNSATIAFSSTIPTREHYNFLGWSTAASSTVPDFVYNEHSNMFTPDSITVTELTSVYAVWEATDYAITWNANGGTVSPTVATKQYGSTLDTLPTPTYAGHNFNGWFTAASGGTQVSSTTVVTGDITYYAHWTATNITGLRYMQDITATACANTATGVQAQLVDSRDDKLYWVAKLADGNCWMTQNLDYDIKATGNIISNNNGTTSTWSPNTPTTTTIFNNSNSTGTYSYNPGNNYFPNGNSTIGTPMVCTSTSNGGINCHYHQGNYYQWNAATAGTGGTITNADATSSICPKGWRLPTSNSATAKYSFGNLVRQYGYSGYNQDISDATLIASPFFFAHGGSIRDGELYNLAGNDGFYWSSTAATSGTDNAYNFRFAKDYYVRPSYGNYRYFGFNVRCVAI